MGKFCNIPVPPAAPFDGPAEPVRPRVTSPAELLSEGDRAQVAQANSPVHGAQGTIDRVEGLTWRMRLDTPVGDISYWWGSAAGGELRKLAPAQGPFGYPDQEPAEVEAEAKAREAPPAEHAKDPGQKFDGGKPRLWLIPGVVLLEIAKVLTFGADKYGADNWQLVKDSRARYGSALLRHFYAWQGGEERDPETGFYHLSHVGANACFLIYHQVRGMFP